MSSTGDEATRVRAAPQNSAEQSPAAMGSISYASLSRRTRIGLVLTFVVAWTHGVVGSLLWMSTLAVAWGWVAVAVAAPVLFYYVERHLAVAGAPGTAERRMRGLLASSILLMSVLAMFVSYDFVLMLVPSLVLLLLEVPRRAASIVGAVAVAAAVFLYWPYYDWNPPSLAALFIGISLFGVIVAADSAIRAVRESRERLAAALRDLSYSNRRLAQSEATAAVAKERSHIASDIHDSIAQSALASLLMLGRVRSEYGRELGRDVADLIEESYLLAESALGEARRLMRHLEREAEDAPSDLYRSPGIREVLSSFEHKARLLGKEIQWELDIMPVGNADLEASRLALRSLGVFLANVFLHSKATRVWVEVERASAGVKLSVRDDGVGFDRGAPVGGRIESTGRGLELLRSRLSEVGGHLEIFSTREQGTTARAWIPDER